MITFLCGPAGYGKSEYLYDRLREDAQNGTRAYLIVPEQQTVSVERHVLDILPPEAQTVVEVLNFSRLANKVFRQFGGLSYHYITKGMKLLLMRRALLESAPLLQEYAFQAKHDAALIPLLLSEFRELKRNRITGTMLEHAAQRLDSDSPFSRKLTDMTLIHSVYEAFVKESYDDAEDDLEKLADLLTEHNFFRDCHVYFDSFVSFTAQEYHVIKRILAQAETVLFSLVCDTPDSSLPHFEPVRETYRALCECAADKPTNVITLTTNHRAKAPALALLEHHLWRQTKQEEIDTLTPEDRDTVRLLSCANAYEEAEAVANTVTELVQSGMRYRDIAIVARDIATYQGILDQALERARIPHFLSQKSDVTEKPLIHMILSLFRIKLYRWRTSDVLGYLKCGLSGLTDKELDVFEDYTATWRISGKRFIEGAWSMNPDGYVREMSPRGAEILQIANAVREKVVPPLEAFFTKLDLCDTVRDMCRTLCDFLEAMAIRDRLQEQADKELALGGRQEYAEIVQLYNICLGVLSDVAEALGDEMMSVEEFAASLRLVFSETEVGSIPTSCDEVLVASASTLRADKIKVAIVIGLVDGEFPKTVSEHSLLGENDRQTLSSLGITLSSHALSRSYEELLFAYRALTLPSHRLYLTTRQTDLSGQSQRPSEILSRVAYILKIEPESYTSKPLADRVWDRQTALSLWRDMNSAWQKAFEAELNSPSLARLLHSHEANDETLSSEMAERLFGRRVSLSQSRLEKFVRCHFSYYCEYILKLRPHESAAFEYSSVGSLVHHILETIIAELLSPDTLDNPPTDEALEALVEEKIRNYLTDIYPDMEIRSNRLGHLFLRLRRLSMLMIRNIFAEFCHSAFRPTFFEMKINQSPDSPIAPPEIKTESGKSILLHGVVDRVDVWQRDGEVYVRIVDYKTGSKEFSREDLALGLNMQLLLYLFAICEGGHERFASQLGIDPATPIKPAGILYHSSNVPTLRLDKPEDGQTVLTLADEKIARSGLLLDDESILRAMNDTLDPGYLPGIKVNREGKVSGKSLIGAEEFSSLYRDMIGTVQAIGQRLYSGNASAKPMKHGGKYPCEYCPMKPVCRADKT